MINPNNSQSGDHPTLSASLSPVMFGLLMFTLFFLLRSLVTFPVEHIDAMFKYDAASRMAEGAGAQELLRNQHTMRWIQTLPQAVITYLTSHRFEGLYLLPLTMFAGYCSLFLIAGRKFLDPAQLALLGLLLFIEPIALNHTGQLLNPPFGVFFSVAGAMILTRKGNPSPVLVVMAALLFFAAYASHVTYASFAGGAFVWLLIGEKRPCSAFLLAIVMSGCLLIETMLFNLAAEGTLPLGRVQALSHTPHMESVQQHWKTLDLNALLFERWTRAPLFDQVIFGGFLLFIFLALWHWKNGQPRLSAFTSCSVIMAGSYALALTFAVTSLNPIRPLIPTRPMYLQPIAPFAIFASVCLLAQLEKRLSPAVAWSIKGGIMTSMVLFMLFEVQSRGSVSDVINARANAFMWRSHSALSDYSQRVREGTLIINGTSRHAMILLARYPKQLTPSAPDKALLATDDSAKVLCVSGLRKIPLHKNYQNC